MSDRGSWEERKAADARLLARSHAPNRLEALTDGVFAIAMTILVLELKVPVVETRSEFIHALSKQAPIFAAYVVSFILLGVYWHGQRRQYDFIQRVDRQLTWLNIFFLLGISAIPFAAALLGEHSDFPEAVHIYGTVLVFCSSIHAWIWWYATNPARGLADPTETTPEVIAAGKRLSAIPVVFYGIAMAISYVDFRLSLLFFAIVPFLYVFDFVRHIRLPGRKAFDEEIPD